VDSCSWKVGGRLIAADEIRPTGNRETQGGAAL